MSGQQRALAAAESEPRPYVHQMRGPRHRWWRPLLAALVGIVSLVDLISRPRGVSPSLPWTLGKRILVGQLMTSPVRYVDSQAHVVELIPLLSTQGLHCLPVMEQGQLVGIITQTDLIAALQRSLLEHLS